MVDISIIRTKAREVIRSKREKATKHDGAPRVKDCPDAWSGVC